jgi:toxin ParE1/3/4
MPDRRYELTQAAAADLEKLYEWGIDQFGLRAADAYYDALVDRFGEIADAPLLWPVIDHIRAGYRRSVCRVHAIYFCIEADGVLIVRILGRQDPETNVR